VEVGSDDGATLLVLDAGTGIRRLGMSLAPSLRRIDILLTHLHLDHIQGLGFFAPLFNPEMEVHIWGPASTTLDLWSRLTRYLSPPLFPVHLRDLACKLQLHEVPCGETRVGPFTISSALICHPGPTVGYRIADEKAVLAYLPDHEPALGDRNFPSSSEWTSGYALAAGADLLIHDAQYTSDEYRERIGWGHSSLRQMLDFASLAGVKHAIPFHHDPTRTDIELEWMVREALAQMRPAFRVTPGAENSTFMIG
jgi:ribonuclease BN (tRNA processing enzyme)